MVLLMIIQYVIVIMRCNVYSIIFYRETLIDDIKVVYKRIIIH